MKVFISWSGNKSHRVAMVFREWLPSVIQSLEPYVSSEDIDKGARWSTDIAKELEDSTFGILCVTKDNLHAPWLSFEAGALSKTMDKSFVTPFLFDIKRSEVNGPILQFQSTIFEKEDIKKLVSTLNKACAENGISTAMLDRAFDVWYPTLEQGLKDLYDMDDEVLEVSEGDAETNMSSVIEELLELSRDNQKLLRNPDARLYASLDDIKQKIEYTLSRFDKSVELEKRQMSRRQKMSFIDEFVHTMLPTCQKQYAFLVILSMFQEDFPWIYDMGKGLVDMLNSTGGLQAKLEAIKDFRRLMEFSLDHPLLRENYSRRKESFFLIKEIPYFLFDILSSMEEELQIELALER